MKLSTVGDMIKELQKYDEKLMVAIFDEDDRMCWISEILLNSRKGVLHINTSRDVYAGLN